MRRSPIRVLIDSEIFQLQTHGGISRYFANLLRHLPRHQVIARLFAPLTFNQHLSTRRTPGFIGVRAPIAFRAPRTERLERRALCLADRLASRWARFDIVHRTFYGSDVGATAPKVVTVYDMIPELFPQCFPAGNPHLGKREACAAAALVIAISEQSKRDLLAHYPDLRSPVEVIHLAVDTQFFQARARGNEDGTLLFVGQRRGYKNFSVFAEAAARLLRERPDLRVLCVGGGPLTAHELAPFRLRACADRVTQRTVSDDELPSTYRRATAFVFPSLYEGFGLPILEAYASGCPVVLSDSGAFREVACDAGEYFEATCPDALLEVLRRVTADSRRREELRRLGEQRLRAFSWNRTAERTAAAYRRALSHEV